MTLTATLSVSVPLHLLAEPPAGGSGSPAAVIGLHGYAMDAESMMTSVLKKVVPENVFVISLQGPHTTLVPGTESTARPKLAYHWGVSPDPKETRATHRAAVEAALAWAVEQGVDRDRIALVAFSQPTSFNYRLAFDPPGGRPLRAVVGLCGGLPGEWADTAPGSSASLRTAAFHVATKEDPFYSLERVAPFEERLRSRFRRAVFQLHEGPHRVPSASHDAIRAFLEDELAPVP